MIPIFTKHPKVSCFSRCVALLSHVVGEQEEEFIVFVCVEEEEELFFFFHLNVRALCCGCW